MKKNEYEQIKTWMEMNRLDTSNENVCNFLIKVREVVKDKGMTLRKAYSEVLRSQYWDRVEI